MVVTTNDFMENIDIYLSMVDIEDILITKDGKDYARLTYQRNTKLDELQSLRGVIKDSGQSIVDIREERLAKHHEVDD